MNRAAVSVGLRGRRPVSREGWRARPEYRRLSRRGRNGKRYPIVPNRRWKMVYVRLKGRKMMLNGKGMGWEIWLSGVGTTRGAGSRPLLVLRVEYRVGIVSISVSDRREFAGGGGGAR